MSKTIAYISNPHSRGNKECGTEKFRTIDSIIEPVGYHIIPKNQEELDEAARFIRDNDISLVIASSGDGGSARLVTAEKKAFENADLPVHIFDAGGNQNIVAKSTNMYFSGGLFKSLMQPSYEEITRTIVSRFAEKIAEELPSIQRNLLHVKTYSKSEELETDMYGFIFADGFVANAMDAYYSPKGLIQKPCKKKIFEILIKSLASIPGRYFSKTAADYFSTIVQRYNHEVKLDDRLLEEENFLGLILSPIDLTINLGSIYLRPFPGIDHSEGAFRLVGGTFDIPDLIRNIPRLAVGIPLDAQGALDGVYKKMDVIPRKNHRFTLDGDMYETAGRTEINAKTKLKFLVT